MQFVLNDQVRREERFRQRLPRGVGIAWAIEPATHGIAVGTLHLTEQLTRLAFPRKAGELIDGCNQERRQAPIDRLIDSDNRQWRAAREFAVTIHTGDAEIQRLLFVRDEIN